MTTHIIYCYVCFNEQHPSQQFFSHVGMISCLPVLNHAVLYKQQIKSVFCSRTQYNDSTGIESRSSNLSISILSLTLYKLSHCAPLYPIVVKRVVELRAGRYYRDTGISRYFISVIRIVIQFGRIVMFSSLFIVTICCWNFS